jgi:hypothetical protein
MWVGRPGLRNQETRRIRCRAMASLVGIDSRIYAARSPKTLSNFMRCHCWFLVLSVRKASSNCSVGPEHFRPMHAHVCVGHRYRTDLYPYFIGIFVSEYRVRSVNGSDIGIKCTREPKLHPYKNILL